MNVLDVVSARQTNTLRQIFQLVRKGSLFDKSSLGHADLAQRVVGGGLRDAKFLEKCC